MKAVVLGGGGLLGRHVADELKGDWEVRAYPRAECDVTDLARVTEVCAGADVILCCAAFTNVDGAESDPTGAWRGNALGSENVARAGLQHGAKVVVISTDFNYTLRPEPGTKLSLDPKASTITLPIVGG